MSSQNGLNPALSVMYAYAKGTEEGVVPSYFYMIHSKDNRTPPTWDNFNLAVLADKPPQTTTGKIVYMYDKEQPPMNVRSEKDYLWAVAHCRAKGAAPTPFFVYIQPPRGPIRLVPEEEKKEEKKEEPKVEEIKQE